MFRGFLEEYYFELNNTLDSFHLKVYESSRVILQCDEKFIAKNTKLFVHKPTKSENVPTVLVQCKKKVFLYQPSQSLEFDIASDDVVFFNNQIYFIKKDKVYAVDIKTKKHELVYKSSEKLTLIEKFKQNLLIANSKIYVISQKGELLETIQQHSTKVTQIFSTGKYFLSIASQDLQIHRYEKKSFTQKCESQPLKVYAQNKYSLALLENGKIQIFDGDNESIVELNAQDVDGAKFLDASVDGEFLNVAYGNNINPTRERVPFLDQGQLKSHLVLTRFLKDQSSNKKTKLIDSTQKAHISGPTSYDQTVEDLPIITDITIEEQVQLLQPPVLDDENEKPSSQITLHQLLTQGIASEDVDLLERAFQITDKKIINATVKRMNPAMIVKLLDHCVARLQKTPARAALLVEWIRSCLLHHSGYLLSVPELTTRLGSLYKTLEKRSETHTKLLKLSGRLDMVISQMETFEKQDGEGEEYVFDAEGESEEEEEDEEDFEDEFEGFDDDDVIMDSD